MPRTVRAAAPRRAQRPNSSPEPVRLLDGMISAADFVRFAAEHRLKTGFEPTLATAQGDWICGAKSRFSGAPETQTLRAEAISEAFRWGEPSIVCDVRGYAFWAVPVVRNQQLLGGIVISGVRLRRPSQAGALDRRINAACQRLLEESVARNWTNGALLAQRRQLASSERDKAEALHALKEGLYDDIRSIYLREEPALVAAIRRSERSTARHVINRVLTAMYVRGQSRMDLLKSLALELVVTMTRTAVQAGADPAEILGLNYQSVTSLSKVHDQEELSAWLCQMLEHLIDAIESRSRHSSSVQLARAFDFMEQNLSAELSRGKVARACSLSPSHFSHLMRAKTGSTFTQLLTRLRLDHACRLLAKTELNLAQVALASGFRDQSYFTRVFRRARKLTPGAYRRSHSVAAASPFAQKS